MAEFSQEEKDNIEIQFNELLKNSTKCRKDEETLASVRKAFTLANEAHYGVRRKSGEPYIHHLIEVAYILSELRAGPKTIIAGLLHDVVEDTDCTIEYIEKRWDKEVATIVDALTKIQRLKLSKITSEEFEAEEEVVVVKTPVKKTKPVVKEVVESDDRVKYTSTMDRKLRRSIKIICAERGLMFATFVEEACREKLRREGVL